jgi:hypothetical protein
MSRNCIRILGVVMVGNIPHVHTANVGLNQSFTVRRKAYSGAAAIEPDCGREDGENAYNSMDHSLTTPE